MTKQSGNSSVSFDTETDVDLRKPDPESPMWHTPATRVEIVQALRYIYAVTGVKVDKSHLKAASHWYEDRGWSKAIWIYVCRNLPADKDSGHNYGRGISPSDVARVVAAMPTTSPVNSHGETKQNNDW